jgi:hypothetical protein
MAREGLMTIGIVGWWLATGCDHPVQPPRRAPDAHKTVDCGGAGDFATIGDALAQAADGDIIDVKPCTYRESVDFGGKAVRLQSTDGAATTIVDGGDSGPVVRVDHGEGDGTALVGFTLTGGVGADLEGAVFVDFSRLRLEDVDITGNRGDAIVYSHSGDVQLADVRIHDNDLDPTGTALSAYRGAIDASRLSVACDSGLQAVQLAHGGGLFDFSDVRCPGSIAMNWIHTTGRVQRTRAVGSMLVDNETGHDTDQVQLENDVLQGDVFEGDGTAVLRNDVILGMLTFSQVLGPVVESNVFAHGGCAIEADVDTTDLAPAYNDFWDVGAEGCDGHAWSGSNGNQAVDPGFTDEDAGDFTLKATSALVDAGLPDAAANDVDGTRNDIGAYGGPKTIAGGW